jgi:hypothetical protein
MKGKDGSIYSNVALLAIVQDIVIVCIVKSLFALSSHCSRVLHCSH